MGVVQNAQLDITAVPRRKQSVELGNGPVLESHSVPHVGQELIQHQILQCRLKVVLGVVMVHTLV
jgi:hypothetical protein